MKNVIKLIKMGLLFLHEDLLITGNLVKYNLQARKQGKKIRLSTYFANIRAPIRNSLDFLGGT